MQDVVAVNLETRRVRLMTAEPQTPRNAEAIVALAVLRQGVDVEFFAAVKAGVYKDGDIFKGDEGGD